MRNLAEDTADAAEGAARLERARSDGGWLEPRTIEGVPFGAGEVAYADLWAGGWRYFGLDSVLYERRTILAGGPYLMAITALGSAIGNRRRRRAAVQLAAPQWRSLGLLRVVVTSDRLLVWHQQAWWSVWFSGICDLRVDGSSETIDLFFEHEPPYRLAGPGVSALGIMLRHAMTWAERLRNGQLVSRLTAVAWMNRSSAWCTEAPQPSSASSASS